MSDVPWEGVGGGAALAHARPGVVVDLRRCTGCHACSVACKTEHGVPLGEFRMRVRWLPRPDRPTFAFLPLFDADTCDLGANRGHFGLAPACVAACPTRALVFGDLDDATSEVAILAEKQGASPIETDTARLRENVVYVGAEPWQGADINKGVPLDPADPDLTYEQGSRGSK